MLLCCHVIMFTKREQVMKLPEYDNRPAPGDPLYADKKASDWDDIKFPLLAIGLPLLVLIFFGSALMDVLDAIKAMLH